MISRVEIEAFANTIVRKFSPEKIILFGSQARGETNADSDVDLLVIMEFEGRSRQMVSAIRSQIRSHFPLDLIVRRTSDIAWRVREGDSFLEEVMGEGTILYEASH
jgi:predicted nucleotidyltransferase